MASGRTTVDTGQLLAGRVQHLVELVRVPEQADVEVVDVGARHPFLGPRMGERDLHSWASNAMANIVCYARCTRSSALWRAAGSAAI
eukprot:8398951-Pyramimonas_sp.AAC.1